MDVCGVGRGGEGALHEVAQAARFEGAGGLEVFEFEEDSAEMRVRVIVLGR